MKRLAYIALCLIILLTGCATSGPSTREQASVYTALRSGNIEQALVELESMQEEYEEPVVYEADKAILTFYANRPEGSISLIAPALDTMEYNSIASFSESIEGLLVNDNVKAYAGSNYENLYLRGINALNYYLMGDAEGAAVEIRRANIISRDYQLNIEEQTNWLESLVLAFTPNPFRYLTIPEVEDYTTSAFINYLSMLMYASMGDSGNASVDYRTLQETAMDPSVVSEEDTAAPARRLARIRAAMRTGKFSAAAPPSVYSAGIRAENTFRKRVNTMLRGIWRKSIRRISLRSFLPALASTPPSALLYLRSRIRWSTISITTKTL